MSLEPITREEHFMARAAGNPGLDLEPITRTEYFLKDIADSGGGGGGGSVTSVNGKTGAVVLTASDVGAAAAETVVEVSGTTPTIEPQANTIYNCGELTALTVTAITNPGDFIIRFTSGATPTTTNFPASMVFPEAFSAEANTRYEINVSNGYALAVGWPTT